MRFRPHGQRERPAGTLLPRLAMLTWRSGFKSAFRWQTNGLKVDPPAAVAYTARPTCPCPSCGPVPGTRSHHNQIDMTAELDAQVTYSCRSHIATGHTAGCLRSCRLREMLTDEEFMPHQRERSRRGPILQDRFDGAATRRRGSNCPMTLGLAIQTVSGFETDLPGSRASILPRLSR